VEPSATPLIAETLGARFRRGSFFDCAPEDLPFTEPIGMRGWLVTFASHFHGAESIDLWLHRDLEALSKLELSSCWYGATDAPVLPFMCELRATHRPLTGADVLEGLNVRDFRSEHIPSLRATRIAYPGYHPYTDNDEIHNDFSEQRIFERKSASEQDGAHGELKSYVEGGLLWYVLLHPTRHEGVCDFAFLFAVGCSPHGARLMGVVTHQVCHNLCD
jgi:hypothetical protein